MGRFKSWMNRLRESELRTHWRLLAATCTLALATPAPLVIRPFSLYFESWRTEFHWTAAQISVAASIFVWTIALGSPTVGRISDRFPAKNVVRGFGAAYCLSMIAIGRGSGSLALLYFSFFCLGIGGMGISIIIFTRLISQCFRKLLGTALACLMLATAASAMVTPLLVQRIIRGDGWRAGWYYLAAAAFLDFMIVSHWLPQPAPGAASESRSIGAQLFRSSQFRLLSVLGMLLVILAETCSITLAPIVREAGVPAGATGTSLAIFGAGSMLGRLGTGFLLDRRPAIEAVLFCVVSALAGFGLLVFGGGGIAQAGCYFLGQASGSEVDVVPYLIRQRFGKIHFGEVSGYVRAIGWFGGAGAVSLMGFSRDATGSYKLMLVLLIVAVLPTLVLAKIFFRHQLPLGEPVSGSEP